MTVVLVPLDIYIYILTYWATSTPSMKHYIPDELVDRVYGGPKLNHSSVDVYKDVEGLEPVPWSLAIVCRGNEVYVVLKLPLFLQCSPQGD